MALVSLVPTVVMGTGMGGPPDLTKSLGQRGKPRWEQRYRDAFPNRHLDRAIEFQRVPAGDTEVDKNINKMTLATTLH